MIKKPVKILCIFIVFMLFIQMFPAGIFAAPVLEPLFAPENLRIEARNPGEPAVGFVGENECYIDIQWDKSSISPYPSATYYNVYIREIKKYGGDTGFMLRDTEKGLPSSIINQPFRISGLKPGTVYQVMVKAYYRVVDGSTVYTSPESPASNVITVLTDIKLTVGPPAGTNHIRIEWDDVWTHGGRIGYRLYISENPGFANIKPIYITPDMIGSTGPVFVNQSTGRLEYIHPVRDPGKIYYVRLAPDMLDGDIYYNPVTVTRFTNTFILVKTTRIASTPSGVVWRIDWSPVVTGLETGLIKAYLIYRGQLGSSAAPEHIATVVNDTSFVVTVPVDDKTTYFRIVADIRDEQTQQEIFPIRITSDIIILKEADVPHTPPMPELVSELRDESGRVLARYEDLLGADTATILWKKPMRADGSIDTDVEYDIWLIRDFRYLDNPADGDKVADSLKIGISNENNLVRDGNGNIVGYRFKLSGLEPNQTYYFKIMAKKRFVDFVDGELSEIIRASEAAHWVIITRPLGPIEQPVVPGKPPLSVKRLANGREAITENSVIIQLKKRWYEKFDESISRWVYIDTSILSDPNADQQQKDSLLALIRSIDDGTADRSKYRVVEYDEGVTLNVGCIKKSELTGNEDFSKIPAEKIIDFPSVPNDPDEVPDIPGSGRRNIDITISGLESNTSYVIWVRAARRRTGAVSEPSDPIIVVTKPIIPEYPEYPTVPTITHGTAYDRYADISWSEFNPQYTYHVAWSRYDDVSRAEKQATVTAADYSLYYRVTDLKPNTGYYFWVRAEVTDSRGRKLFSDWSDSYYLRTLPDMPPNPPRGFGIANVEGAVGKDSITYEWLREGNLRYILRIAENPDFTDAKEFDAGKTSTYTVTGLRSNYRYYAVLFAYDEEKDLISAPSPVVVVRTRKSTDEYDSDQDTEDVITGDFIIKEPRPVNRTWYIRITGVNADRFVEYVAGDNVLDFRLYAGDYPVNTERICLEVSGKVIDSLGRLKENLVIDTGFCEVVVRPHVLPSNLGMDRPDISPAGREFTYRIYIRLPHKPSNTAGLTFHTNAVGIEIEAGYGENATLLRELDAPLRIDFIYSGSWYQKGVTAGYVYSPWDMRWEKCPTELISSGIQRYISVETAKTGEIGIASEIRAPFSDLAGQPADVVRAITKITELYRLKSVEGSTFRPFSYALTSDAVKFMLDVLSYNYGSDYMYTAAKAGLVTTADISAASQYCTRQKAAAMAVRVYEIKTSQAATVGNPNPGGYADFDSVDPALSVKVRFALQNGILDLKEDGRIDPWGPVSRGEIMVMLEKVLIMCGEID